MKDLEEFKTVRLWIKKACGSKDTEIGYTNKFRQFLESVNANPDEIVEQWKAVRYNYKEREKFIDEWTEKIEEYYALLELSPLSKIMYVTVVVSFFKKHKIPIEIDYKKHAYVKYHNRDITKEELRRILEHSKLRNRTFYLMMLESGQRPKTLCQLRYRQIKEDFEANRVPMKINLPEEILKDRVANRFTFIGEDGFNALKEYLSPRMPLEDDDVIFQRDSKGNRSKGEVLIPTAFSRIFGELVLKLGIAEMIEKGKPRNIRLYCLRKYFRKYCIPEDTAYREFWMAHSLGTDEHYISRDVEHHRDLYKKAYPKLRVYEGRETIDNLKEHYESKIKELESQILTEGQIDTMIKERIEKEIAQAFNNPIIDRENPRPNVKREVVIEI